MKFEIEIRKNEAALFKVGDRFVRVTISEMEVGEVDSFIKIMDNIEYKINHWRP